jgi:predicted glycoside hydrolase/deacetylase ChbG (UPF0249 family)
MRAEASPPSSEAAAAPRARVLACADDMGVDAASDAVQLQLLADRRLCGASVLVDGAHAAEALRAAAALRSGVGARIGLHLNLTEPFGQPFAVRPLGRWLLAAHGGALARERALKQALTAEVRRQLERFGELAGCAPDYLDGHQHVHGLPGVAAPLLAALDGAGLAALPLRDVRPRRFRGLKAAVIARLCGALPQAAVRIGDDFVGVYGFDSATPYETRAKRWIESIEDGSCTVWMCHPGAADAHGLPYARARAGEAAFFASPRWPQLLAEQRLMLG